MHTLLFVEIILVLDDKEQYSVEEILFSRNM